jgi:hypothetical protein
LITSGLAIHRLLNHRAAVLRGVLALYAVCTSDPVSRRVFRLDKTAGHP